MNNISVRVEVGKVEKLFALADHAHDKSRSFDVNDLTLNLTKESAIQIYNFLGEMIDTWDAAFPMIEVPAIDPVEVVAMAEDL